VEEKRAGTDTLICKPGDIFKLLGEVTREIEAITKQGKTSFGEKYEYRRVDDVIDAVHGLYGEKGITLVPEQVGRVREEHTTSNGKRMIFSLQLIRYYLVAPDGSYVAGMVEGEGSDTLDKSMNKSMSAALKYFLGTVHLIPFKGTFIDSEDDSGGQLPEIDSPTPTTLIAKINKTNNFYELQNWWKKHEPEVGALPQVKRDEVTAAKDKKKAVLLEAAEKAVAEKAAAEKVAAKKAAAEKAAAEKAATSPEPETETEQDELYNELAKKAGELLKKGHDAKLLKDENGELLTMPGYIIHYHKKDKLGSMNATQLADMVAALDSVIPDDMTD
jgi:hypothetical protein